MRNIIAILSAALGIFFLLCMTAWLSVTIVQERNVKEISRLRSEVEAMEWRLIVRENWNVRLTRELDSVISVNKSLDSVIWTIR